MNIFKRIKLISTISKKISQIEKILKGNKDLINEIKETIENLVKKIPQLKDLIEEIKLLAELKEMTK